jgi:hypothetical protein
MSGKAGLQSGCSSRGSVLDGNGSSDDVGTVVLQGSQTYLQWFSLLRKVSQLPYPEP